VNFEKLIGDLSARFLEVPAGQVDCEIEASLRCLVEFFALDRSVLFQLSEDGSTLVVTHCWAVPAVGCAVPVRTAG
jgi:hypothetical protein